MIFDRLPRRPPPRACHFFIARPLTDGSGRLGQWYDASCGHEAARLHGTTNPDLVTCPYCREDLGQPAVPTPD